MIPWPIVRVMRISELRRPLGPVLIGMITVPGRGGHQSQRWDEPGFGKHRDRRLDRRVQVDALPDLARPDHRG